MKKALLAVILTLCIVLGNIGVFAAENDQRIVPSGEIAVTQQEYEAYLASLSEEELQIIAQKEAAVNAILEERAQRVVSSRSLISLPRNFTIFIQESSTYCVPATIKSILIYLVGTSPSQSSIASSISGSGSSQEGGYYASVMPSYLNSRQSLHYYCYVAFPGQSFMCGSIEYAVGNCGVPASLGLNTLNNPSWGYASPGHSVVAYAITNDYSSISIADPLNYPTVGKYYTHEGSLTHDCCQRIVY